MRSVPARALSLVLSGFAVAWLSIRFRLPLPAALILWAGCVGALVVFGVGVARVIARQEGRRRTLARGLGLLGAATLGIVALLVLPALSGYVANAYRLDLFARPLHDHPPPPGTRVLSSDAEVGLFTGNGDHCDYRATVALSSGSTVSRSEVEAHYEGFRPRSAVAGGDDSRVRLDVEAEPPGPAGGGTVYVVRLTDVHGANADLRCW